MTSVRIKVGEKIQEMPIDMLRPSPENELIYRPVLKDDEDIRALSESILRVGRVCEPLIISMDGWILSGHRRRIAAQLAGLETVPCLVAAIRREDDLDRWSRLIRECNEQRHKNYAVLLREQVLTSDPEEVYQALIEHRRAKAAKPDFGDVIDLGPVKKRKVISPAKKPMLDAIQQILRELKPFWPLSDRRIHYNLLNLRPLRHASKRRFYRNDPESYKDLTDLLTRARVAGVIPFEAIGDETRPFVQWDAHPDPRSFIRHEIDQLLKGYTRDLQQSQPNWIEIVGEKMTLKSIIEPISMRYCVPYTLGRGFSSLAPRHDMLHRFRRSGREKLVILIMSDLDPAGMTIAESFARSMRDDFQLHDDQIRARKVALTHDQVRERQIPHGEKATAKRAATRKEFIRRYGQFVYELEALSPDELQALLQRAIDDELDVEMFNKEIDAEKRDATFLDVVRRKLLLSIQEQSNEL